MQWIRHEETDLPTVILDGAQAETCCTVIWNYCNGLRLENPHATAFSMHFNQRLHSERRTDAITLMCARSNDGALMATQPKHALQPPLTDSPTAVQQVQKHHVQRGFSYSHKRMQGMVLQ